MRMSLWTMQQPGSSEKRRRLMPQSQESSWSRYPKVKLLSDYCCKDGALAALGAYGHTVHCLLCQ